MSDLNALATAAFEQQQKIDQLEQELKVEQEFLRTLLENDLPDAMQAEGFDKIKLPNGVTAVLETTYHGGISEKNQEQAHRWLIENGMSRMIKTKMVIGFGMGALEAAIKFGNEIRKILPSQPIDISWEGATKTDEAKEAVLKTAALLLGPDHGLQFSLTVHPNTLTAFIRKQFEKGTKFPSELFGAFVRTAVRLDVPEPEDGKLEEQLKASLVKDAK